jgi:hypothetical protein
MFIFLNQKSMVKYSRFVVLAAVLLWSTQFTSVLALSFNPYPTGTLVNDSGTIYFISGNQKVPFTNWDAFSGLGYSLQNVVQGDLTNYPLAQGYTLNTASAAHPWGSWLIYQGTVYYSTQAGLIGVPSSAVFTSNGGDWQYIVRANQWDVSALNANPNLPILQINDPRVGASTYGGVTGTLQLSTSSLNFTQVVGTTLPAQSFTVNPGSSTASWTASVYSGSIPGLNVSSGSTVGAGVSGVGPAPVTVVIAGSQNVGTYSGSILVTSGSQVQSIAVTLTVTGSSSTGAPVITSISPTTAAIGSQVTVTGTGFGSTNTVEIDGLVDASGLFVNSYGSLTFTLSPSLSPYCNSSVCSQLVAQLMPGTHSLSVLANGLQSNSVTITVTSGSTGQLQLSTQLLTFTGAVGNVPPAAQSFTVNPGSSTASWTASAQYGSIPGLNVSSGSTVGAGVSGVGPATVTVVISGSSFALGTYSGSISVASGGLTQLVTVIFTVTNSGSTGTPAITGVSPSSGPVGTLVTVTGSGFTSSNNAVLFQGGPTTSSVISGLGSSNGTQLQFTVPAVANAPTVLCVVQGCSFTTTAGLYSISVSNANGASNTQQFTVTAGSGSNLYPTITSISPVSGAAGTQVTVSGSGFSLSGNNVAVSTSSGIGNVGNLASASGTNLQFTVPPYLSHVCTSTQSLCIGDPFPIGAGSVSVTVTNASGYTSSPVTFTVTSGVGGSIPPSGAPVISVSPSSGPSSAAVTLTATSGTLFTASNNEVDVSGNLVAFLSSANGQVLFLQLPVLSVGSHSIVVHNANGSSNVVTYTVTQ